MRKITFILYILSIIILGLLGVWIGTYAYKINSIGRLEMPILEGMENKSLEYELALMVNESEERISPNTVLVIKNNYTKCGHELKKIVEVDDKYVNLNKEEFEQEFLKDNENFNIENFTTKEIIILKNIDEKCDEHYLLKSNNGVIIVYKYNKNGVETIYKKTNIGVEFLTDADREELEKGIEVIGESQLNSRLEDYV